MHHCCRNGLVAFFFVLFTVTTSIESWPQRPVQETPWGQRRSSRHAQGHRERGTSGLASRSIATQQTRRNLVDPSAPVGAPQVRRSDNGTLKILYGAQPPRGVDQPDIVFPGPITGEGLFKMPNIGKASPCGAEVTYCEEPIAYPNYTDIEGLLQNSARDYSNLLGVDELEAVQIGQRIDYASEFTLCSSNEQVVFPKAAKNKAEKWLFVVNQPNYEQGVRVDICQSERSTCEFSGSFPSGYEATCRQKYIYRKLLALDESGDTITDLFRLPSCCSCVIKNPGGVAARMGFDDPNTRQSKARRSPAN